MQKRKGGGKNTLMADRKEKRIMKESTPASWLRGSFSPARDKRRRERHEANHEMHVASKSFE